MGVAGEVYLLHNCGMRQGLLKIGRTIKSAEDRAADLWTTGVPGRFEVLFAWHVDDAPTVERRLHERFSEYRYDDRREFFYVTPRRAITALLEEAGVIPLERDLIAEYADGLSKLIELYGPLLDQDLCAVRMETGSRTATSLVCTLNRDGDLIVLRRDMEFLSIDGQSYFENATNAREALTLLLALDPNTLVEATPLFSRRGGQLILDLHRTTGMGAAKIREVLDASRTGRTADPLDEVERIIRANLNLHSYDLDLIAVTEYEGRFLLSLRPGTPEVHDLRISAETPNLTFPHEAVSVAVITKAEIEVLEIDDVFEIGYRDSPSTWTTAGPFIRVAGIAPNGVPFEQAFSFLP
jgi:hypothetical protein